MPGIELASVEAPSQTNEGYHSADMNPHSFARAIVDGAVRIIDVRTPEEFATGAIAGAENIPVDRFDPAKLDLGDGSKVLLYCRSGRRSGIALKSMVANGAEHGSHLAGGILAWQAAGYPVK